MSGCGGKGSADVVFGVISPRQERREREICAKKRDSHRFQRGERDDVLKRCDDELEEELEEEVENEEELEEEVENDSSIGAV